MCFVSLYFVDPDDEEVGWFHGGDLESGKDCRVEHYCMNFYTHDFVYKNLLYFTVWNIMVANTILAIRSIVTQIYTPVI